MDGATPFFGAKISLISKSEIRYEGVLYTIDPKESTIALAKVRSFGTENRQADRPVPPRDEIFEFIIFRASDIKDLVVDDAPTNQASPPAPQPVFDDPAIVSSKSIPPGGPLPSTGGASSSATSTGGPASTSQGSSSGGGATSSKPTENGSAEKKPQQSAPKPAWGGVGLNFHHQQNGQQNNRQQQQQNRGGDQQQQNRQPRGQYQQQQQHRGGPQHMNNYNQRGGMGGGGYRPQQGPGGYRHQGQGNYGQMQGGQQQRGYNQGRMGGGMGMGMGGGNYRGGRGGMRGRPNHHHYQPRNNGPIKFAPLPDGEFDFEKAHSDFQMLEEKLKALKLNNGQAEGADGAGSSSGEMPTIEGIPASAITVSALEEEADVPSEPCYNKSTSFFDNISCEAVEREKGIVKRVDWKAERSLNKETFGVSSARPPQRYFNNNRRGGYGFTNRA